MKKFEKDAVQATRDYENRELVLPNCIFIFNIILKILLVGS